MRNEMKWILHSPFHIPMFQMCPLGPFGMENRNWNGNVLQYEIQILPRVGFGFHDNEILIAIPISNCNPNTLMNEKFNGFSIPIPYSNFRNKAKLVLFFLHIPIIGQQIKHKGKTWKGKIILACTFRSNWSLTVRTSIPAKFRTFKNSSLVLNAALNKNSDAG